MTEQQNKLIKAYDKYVQLLSDELGDLIPGAAVHGWTSKRYEQGIKCREEISLLKLELSTSPLPHQDGASAEDVLDGYYCLSIEIDDDCPVDVEEADGSRIALAYVRTDCIKAMHQFAKSETAKVVEKYEKEIAELKAKIDYLNIR